MIKNLWSAHMRASSGWSAKSVGTVILAFGLIFCFTQGALPVDAAAPTGTESPTPRKSKGGAWKAEDLTVIEETILQLTNSARKEKGLSPLVQSPALAFLARGQTKNMCQTGKLVHESDDFPGQWKRFMQRLEMVRVRSGGENIAFRTTTADASKWASEIVKGWLKSPPHRKNILDPRWRYLGVGVERCGNRTAYAAQEFSAEPGTTPKDTSAAAGP